MHILKENIICCSLKTSLSLTIDKNFSLKLHLLEEKVESGSFHQSYGIIVVEEAQNWELVEKKIFWVGLLGLLVF